MGVLNSLQRCSCSYGRCKTLIFAAGPSGKARQGKSWKSWSSKAQRPGKASKMKRQQKRQNMQDKSKEAMLRQVELLEGDIAQPVQQVQQVQDVSAPRQSYQDYLQCPRMNNMCSIRGSHPFDSGVMGPSETWSHLPVLEVGKWQSAAGRRTAPFGSGTSLQLSGSNHLSFATIGSFFCSTSLSRLAVAGLQEVCWAILTQIKRDPLFFILP